MTDERWRQSDIRLWVCSRATGDVLEVAVGSGLNLAHYAPDVRITAIDRDHRQVRRARARVTALGRAVDLRQADAQALPFGDASFDTVTCTFAMCAIPDMRLAMSEALRVLRPGGSYVLADHVVATSAPLRVLQRVAESFTRRAFGEHFTRRPLLTLKELDVELVDVGRSGNGSLERVHARKPM